MAFVLVIMEPPGQRGTVSEEEGRGRYEVMLQFGNRLKERGLLGLGQSLASASKGVRVSVRDGKRALVDGPFLEAKEMVGGFFLIETSSRDEAVAIAAECPAAAWATVEVREAGPCFT